MHRDTRLGFTAVELGIVTALLAAGIIFVIPAVIRSRALRDMRTCQENLTKIDGAKEQWALENNKGPGVMLVESEIVRDPPVPGYIVAMPSCPSGGVYTINAVGADPTCSTGFPGHALAQVCCAITELE